MKRKTMFLSFALFSFSAIFFFGSFSVKDLVNNEAEPFEACNRYDCLTGYNPNLNQTTYFTDKPITTFPFKQCCGQECPQASQGKYGTLPIVTGK
jgi:hypothetical protein